jgi:hypothetical protein
VRKLLGYVRYDTLAAQAAMQALYRHELRLFQNLFLPSVKLLCKERVGARVRRRYDAPRTPLERVQAAPGVDRHRVAALCALRDRLDPFVLARTIDQKLEQIYALASRQHRPDTVQSAAPSESGTSPPRRGPAPQYPSAASGWLGPRAPGNPSDGAMMLRKVTIPNGSTGGGAATISEPAPSSSAAGYLSQSKRERSCLSKIATSP